VVEDIHNNVKQYVNAGVSMYTRVKHICMFTCTYTSMNMCVHIPHIHIYIRYTHTHTCTYSQAELLEVLANVARAQTLGLRRGKALCERLGFLCKESHEILFSYGMVGYIYMYIYIYIIHTCEYIYIHIHICGYMSIRFSK
jgi:hypothetical protein